MRTSAPPGLSDLDIDGSAEDLDLVVNAVGVERGPGMCRRTSVVWISVLIVAVTPRRGRPICGAGDLGEKRLD